MVVYSVVVDLDADGQVDLVTVSSEPRHVEGDVGERDTEDCYSLGVHWMRPGPVVSE